MTSLSIINMRQSPLHPDNIRDFGAQPDTECIEICKAIRPFFTDEKWGEWVDAGPNDNPGFLEYARAEWQIIHDEFHFAEPPAPEGERDAAASAEIDEWLGSEVSPQLNCHNIAVANAEYNVKRAHETGIDIEWAEQRLQEEIVKRNNYFATRPA